MTLIYPFQTPEIMLLIIISNDNFIMFNYQEVLRSVMIIPDDD
ncbi:hypothetical protein V415_21740 [Escherichia coli LAU-EC10]|nr:hypothetical protein ECVR50_3245 [Escherichia coli VR50]ETE17827.1 hypothetical protein V415_21740 [Escherichia coli LAU-EC10]